MKNLRFRIQRGTYEIELEGDFDYVHKRFEELLSKLKISPARRDDPA